ncbi:MAG: YihA family ribosome biogenesis GTP-binding protein [Rickettsiales bacterium]|nr:YihA family ribosome biogenesis GTP-binding protein [Rickettsiales bacterium]MCA0254060.1 ribosome biogenesis GTP-binding protein YihA/YsxC [Pseudomonadota bacterium]
MADGIGTKIFRQEAKFIAGAMASAQIPKLFLPQFAFVGKSNVGKSSLINAITNRKALARVSHTPGRTQQINFFSLAEKFILVDLPGYGFAKVSHNKRASWEHLITNYLKNSQLLRRVFLLVDARRGLKEHDIEVIELLKTYQRNYQVIFTKTDQVKDIDSFIKEMTKDLDQINANNQILLVSSRTGGGIRELQKLIVNDL